MNSAASGELALQAVETHGYDLILMDCQMPEMNGLQTTQRLLSAHPDLAIVAITAHCSSKDKRLSLESGMLAHLNKPFTLHQLQQILHRFQPSKGPPNRSAEGSP